ncbi:MAG: hypothetical protein KBC41_01190 [Candidatus Pacebacteria bacterium]|nr:hypothetical protein [Candidatus Paceibacterota bacterium]MBP9866677.1 hypothetical protein [Candidatus Paceibacterota bacterium]
MVATIFEYSYTILTFFGVWYTVRKTIHIDHSLKKKIFSWILFGFVFNLYSLSWVYTVYPVLWMKEGVLQLLSITTLLTLSAFTASVSFGVVGYAIHKHSKELLKPFIFALSLVVAEIGRSLLLSALYYGSGSTIGLHWTAGTIGNALSTTPFIEYAYFGGTFMLTGVLGYIVYCFLSIKNIQQYYKHILTLSILLIGIHYLLPVHGPEKPISVAVITTNFTHNSTISKEYIDLFFKDQTKTLTTMTQSLISSSPDIIVYPEDTRYIEHLSKKEKANLFSLFKDTIFVDSTTYKKQAGLSVYTLLYSPSQEKTPGRGKKFLMLFNEYIPVFFNKLFTMFIHAYDFEKYKEQHSYEIGTGKQSISLNGIRIGTIICSEILSFKTMSSLLEEKPDILIYQSHLSVFHNNPWFVMHMRSFTKITSAYMRTPLIGSSNGSPSFVVSPYGSIVNTDSTGFNTSLYKVSKEGIYLIK